MPKTPSSRLFDLIKSLSGSEKRYFKVMNKAESNSKYWLLFEAIEEQEQFDDEALQKIDLRYVIGGLLMKRIYEKEGVAGWLEALRYGTSDEDFYRLLEDKLGVTKTGFDRYVKTEMKQYRFSESEE